MKTWIKTAHGYLSFQPPPDGNPQGAVTLQYRPTAGAWEEIDLEGFEVEVPPDPETPPETPPESIPAMENAEYVGQVKAALVAQGVSVAGPDGAFQITSNVAYGLRLVGYGLLEKTSGNMSQGYAVDVIVCPNRVDLVDILGDAGGQNTPSWQVKPDEVTSDRWRPPVPPAHPV